MSDKAERRRFRYFGADDPMTAVTRLIMAEDIAGLDNELGKSWRLNEPFKLLDNQYGGTALAIELALVESRYKVIDYLLSKRADLNVPKAPAIVSAVSANNPDLIDKLIAAGADVRARNNVGYDAMAQAVAWEHFELIPRLEAHGLRFDNGSGEALHNAIHRGHRELVAHMLKGNADPNQSMSRSQGGLGERPLHTATYSRDLEIVKLLVKHGADPGLPNVHGQRAYLYAWAVLGLNEMAQWLRAQEPSIAHEPDAMRKLARSFNAPDELIQSLGDEPRTLGTTPEGEPVVTLLPLTDLYRFTGMGRKFLALSLQVYKGAPVSDIVWSARQRRVFGVDVEHGEVFKLGTWPEFAARPLALLESIHDRAWRR